MRLVPTDIPLSLAILGLRLEGDDDRSTPDKLRAALHLARTLGVAGVHLNGAMADLRARELDRSARRELAALLRRYDLALAGIDLLIPPAHFVDSAHLDRALTAVAESIGLVADLRTLLKETPGAQVARDYQPVICITLPHDATQSVRAELAAHASKAGVRIADLSHHRQPIASTLASASPATNQGGPLGHALDPAAALMAGDDPAAVVAKNAASLFNIRLTDASSDGRCALGRGRLDIAELQIALSAWRYTAFATLDLRAVSDQEHAAPAALKAWTTSG